MMILCTSEDIVFCFLVIKTLCRFFFGGDKEGLEPLKEAYSVPTLQSLESSETSLKSIGRIEVGGDSKGMMGEVCSTARLVK